jgi:tRNA(adenine34) deaminase
VGAVVVLEGRVIGIGWNGTRKGMDPTAHAEVLAIRQAAGSLGAQRMPGATLYCTVEPCFMCAGAASHARVARIVFAIRDPKFGACGSLGDVPGHPALNHRSSVSEGLCADEARALMVDFFREKRRAARGESEHDSAS